MLCIGMAMLCGACNASEAKEEKVTEKFQVVHPVVMDTVFNKEYVAEIQSVQHVELRARVKGFIEKIHADEGKPVAAGQVLFTISSRAFREELLKANAQLKSAMADEKSVDLEIKNTKLLADKNIVSKTELDMLQAKKEAIQAAVAEAHSSIKLAELNIGFTQVTAPFSGVINRIPNKVGSLVDEGTLLTSIANNKEVFAYFNVSENEYLDFIKRKELGKQEEISLVLSNGEIFSQKGFIETAENEIDKSSGNIAFRARFANPNQLLKHGSSGKILLSKDLKNALIIPQKSTFEIQDKTYVYVLDKDNKVRMRSIVTSLRLPHIYIIESGLTPDDKVIYEGIQQMKEGDTIVPESVNMNIILAKVNN